MHRLTCLVQLCLSLLCAAVVPAAWASNEQAARADAIFAAWNKPDTPGAAVAVVRDGQLLYRRAFGMAQLEHAAQNTPATVFHAASVSKQFTAFAIHLLVQDGKLALDDEVRKLVPELQAGAGITLRHLLHHTSGLRDQWNLLLMAGLRLDDVITDADVLGLLWRQRELNFAPGSEVLYSNSGYTLLALVVQRVSGQSLNAFAQARIFGPLGMKHTRFQENYNLPIPGRAYSYQRTPAGYRYVALSFSTVGPSSLMTTVDDLALWQRNFDEPKVGTAATLAALQARGRLNNASEIAFASGLAHGSYRGLPTVGHDGADAAFRAQVLRFPEQRLSVLLLGNAGDMNSGELARRVADVYLEGTAGLQARASLPAEVQLDAAALQAFVGDFEMRPGFVLSFTAQGAQLRVQATDQPMFPLFASAPDRFFTKAFPSEVHFDAPGADGKVASATWLQGGSKLPLKRVVVVAQTPAAELLAKCVGDYYSDELRTIYTLDVREGKAMLRYPRGEIEIKTLAGDLFGVPFPINQAKVKRDADGRCSALLVGAGRVRDVLFKRVNLAPAP
jgi:CubicO group peptidase (beta-lactamase class C family)